MVRGWMPIVQLDHVRYDQVLGQKYKRNQDELVTLHPSPALAHHPDTLTSVPSKSSKPLPAVTARKRDTFEVTPKILPLYIV
jgi:hypothetical protein